MLMAAREAPRKASPIRQQLLALEAPHGLPEHAHRLAHKDHHLRDLVRDARRQRLVLDLRRAHVVGSVRAHVYEALAE